MTIPSLGGNGGNGLNKIHINNSVPQVNSVEVPQDAPAPVAQEEVKPEQSAVKNEYSIEQFRADYENMVVNRILPELQQYEGERKKRLIGAVISAIFFAVAGVLVFFLWAGR